MIYKTLHRKQQIEQHEPHLNYLFTYTVAQHDFHQMMFVSFNSNTAVVKWGKTGKPSGPNKVTPRFSGGRVARTVALKYVSNGHGMPNTGKNVHALL
jgi:hypothetical protein